MVNTSHHTATVTNDTRTACAASARPNSAGLLHHQHVDEEQQAAAEIAQRIAEGGDAVELLGLATSSSSESLNTTPPLKPMVAEHEQRQRRRTTRPWPTKYSAPVARDA